MRCASPAESKTKTARQRGRSEYSEDVSTSHYAEHGVQKPLNLFRPTLSILAMVVSALSEQAVADRRASEQHHERDRERSDHCDRSEIRQFITSVGMRTIADCIIVGDIMILYVFHTYNSRIFRFKKSDM